MADLQVISIDPSKKTLGSLHPEMIERVMRVRSLSPGQSRKRSGRSFLNLCLGVNPTSMRQVSWKMLLVRAGVSSYLGLLAGISWQGGLALETAVYATMAVSFLLGFLQRAVAVSALAYFGYIAITGAMTLTPQEFAQIDTGAVLTVLLSFMMALFGPGRYCVDSLIRKGIHIMARRRRARKESVAASRRMSYQAYKYHNC